MLLAHVPHRKARRRGAILLIVLTLLALFAVIGLGFVLFAESEAIASRDHKEAVDDITPFDDLAIMDGYNQQTLNQFATNLIFGGSGQGSDAFSATYGNDLSTSRFVSNKATPTAGGSIIPSVAGPQVGVYGGTGALTSTSEAAAMGFPAGTQLPVLFPGGMAVERESIVNFSPIVDAAGGYGVYPEFTGLYTFGPTGVATPLMANGNPYTNGAAPQFQSKAAPYTYPDANNLYLAQVRPDTGDLVTPSFHRDYVFGRRLMPGAPVTGNNPQQLNYDPSVNFATNSLNGSNPNWYTRSGRLRISRPRPWDQLTPGEQSTIATNVLGSSTIPETLTPAQAGQLTSTINGLVSNGVLPNVMPMPGSNADGTVTGDVQNLRGNMATQKNDSVWIYPGGPVLSWRDKRVVAMVAPMILDTSSKANLNVVSNFTGFTQTAYRYTDPKDNVLKFNRIAASRSNLGMGPHEINLSRLLRDNNSFTLLLPVANNQVGLPTTGEIQRALLVRNGQSQPSVNTLPSTLQVAPTLLPGQQPINDRYTNSVAVFNKGRYVPSYSPFDLRASVEPIAPTSPNNSNGSYSLPSGSVSPIIQLNSPPGPNPTTIVGGANTFPTTLNNNQYATSLPLPATQLADYAADTLFNPSQWLRAYGTSASGPHQFGPDNDRRLSTRYGLSPNDVFRTSSMTEIGTLMPGNMGSFGNTMGVSVTGSDSYIANPTEAARAFFTTYSSSMSRPDLPVEIARTPPANGNSVIINRVSLSPIDMNRPLGDYRVDPNKSLDPTNIFPLDVSMLPAQGLFTSQSNVEAYKPYCVARQSRQNLARDIFVRLAALTKFTSRLPSTDSATNMGTGSPVMVDGIEICFDPNTGYLRHFNATTGKYESLIPAPLPPQPLPTPLPAPTAPANIYQDRFDALRSIAQVAANMVDYIDNDDIKTAFVWNPVTPLFQDNDAADPTAQPAPYPILQSANNANNPGTNGANALNRQLQQQPVNVNPNPALYLPLPQKGLPAAVPPVSQFIDPSADQSNFVIPTGMTAGTPVMDQHVVFGTELPRLLINETLATSEKKNGNPGNGNNPQRTKRFWVEFYNPLPIDSTDTRQQLAVSEGGLARLRYLQSTSPTPPPPAQPTQTTKNTYGPYRMEIFTWQPPANGNTTPTLASLLQQFPNNVTGDLELLFAQAAGQPGVPTVAPEIRIDDFSNVTGTGPNNPPSPTILQPEPDMAATPNKYTVQPYGPPNASTHAGFFVVGPKDEPLAPINAVPTDTRLKDAPQGGNPNQITPNSPPPIAPAQANNYMTIEYNVNQNNGNGPNNSPNSKHAVVLRRLANPHMQPNPDPNANPPYNPNLPYNPYITVDLMDQITAVDHTNQGQGNGNGPSGSVSRQLPYAASIPSGQFFDRTAMQPQPTVPNPGPLTVQQGGQTFRAQNSINTPVQVDTTGWPPHMDRELVNSLELLFVSSAPPYLMTSNFGKLYQLPQANPPSQQSEQTSVFWHTNANTVQTVLSGTQSFTGDTAPSADFSDWPRALDFLTVRSRLTGIPVGGPVPGKVNINTIWDERDDEYAAPPNQPSYAGTAQDPNPPQNTFPYWRKPMSSRMLKAILDPADSGMVSRNHFDPSAVAYMWQPSPTTLQNNRLGRTSNYPAVSAADQPYLSFSGAFGGSSNTLLRTRTDGNPLFYHSTPPQPHNKAGINKVAPVQPHPYTRVEPLQKMLNSVTTTSDTFMVILTVSYFEVRGMDTNVSGMPRPLIGREAFRDMPGDLRKQYAMIVDRSQLTIEDPALVTQGSATMGVGSRAVPWFTEQLADSQPGDNRITVRGVLNGANAFVIRDGVTIPIPTVPSGAPKANYFDSNGSPLNAIRIGFGDPNAAVKGDGEWAWVLSGPDLPNPTRTVGPTSAGAGAVVLTVSTQPWSSSNPLPQGLTNAHAAGTPISNAIHGTPGPQSLMDLNQPRARGVVPYINDIPR